MTHHPTSPWPTPRIEPVTPCVGAEFLVGTFDLLLVMDAIRVKPLECAPTMSGLAVETSLMDVVGTLELLLVMDVIGAKLLECAPVMGVETSLMDVVGTLELLLVMDVIGTELLEGTLVMSGLAVEMPVTDVVVTELLLVMDVIGTELLEGGPVGVTVPIGMSVCVVGTELSRGEESEQQENAGS